MRRSYYLVFILLLIAQTSFGQIYQNMAQPGYKFSRARFDSVLTIPTGLGGLRNITGGQDTGQIRFNVSDSSVYVWNGRAWIKAGGGGSGSIDYVTQGYGIKVDSSGRVYTVRVDSTVVGSKTYIDAKDALKLNIADTATMLTPYAKTAALADKLNISDTASMLSNYAKTSAVNLKLNISDTATMLAPYSRVGVTSYGKNATRDSTILLLSNGTRFAARDSIGGGGGGSAKAYTPLIVRNDSVYQRFNVLAYGADNTGTTDATTAIQAAINAANNAGGGEVYFPNGTYIIAGARNATSNSQIQIPNPLSVTARGTIILKGESTSMTAAPGGLSTAAATQPPTSGVILKSTLSTFTAAGQAVIGSASNNTNSLVIEDINIQVKNNPSGTGPVVGGISWKNGYNFIFNRVSAYIDTSGYRSTLPSNDVSGIETPDNNLGQNYSINSCEVAGFRSGIKMGEHVTLNNVSTIVCYYGINFKNGFHSSTSARVGIYWCAYNLYVSGFVTLSNFKFDSEWQQVGKWYDDIATVSDSANLAKGQLFYTIVQAGVGVNNTKFVKSGGSNLFALPDSVGVAGFNGITNNQNGATAFKIENTTSGTASQAYLQTKSTTLSGYFGIRSPTTTALGSIVANDVYLLADNTALNIATTGSAALKFSTSTTANPVERARISGAGNFIIGSTTDDAINKLQVTGTSNFIGNLGVGASAFAPTELIHIKGNNAANNQILVESTNAAGQANTRVKNTSGDLAQMGIYGSTTSAYGTIAPRSSYLYSNSLAPMNIFMDANQPIIFSTGSGAPATERMRILGTGNFGIGLTAPTALLHIKAGTATASTAPLKFTSGTNLTTPEAGAMEFNGTNYFVTSSTTRFTLAKTLVNTATLDFGNTAAGAATDLTITVTGAADGDAVSIGVPNGSTVANGSFTAWVSATNTVTIRFSNSNLVTALDPASGTFRAVVLKY